MPEREEFMPSLKTFHKPKDHFGLNRFRNLPGREELKLWSQSAGTDKYFRTFFLIWGLSAAVTAIYALARFSSLPSQIPLFYSRPWGEAQLAPRPYIFLPIVGAFLLGIFNLSLAVSFHARNQTIAYFLAGTASLVALLAAITVINIIILME